MSSALLRHPRFVSLEGGEGAGKTTAINAIRDCLRSHGHEVVLTREPGGSPGAEQIRRLLVEGRTDRWSPETELLLFTAARRDHLERTITPALDRGAWVVTDRFADSTRVYQGAARADLAGQVEALHRLMIGIEPNRTFVIDLDPAEALARAAGRSPRPSGARKQNLTAEGAAEDRFEAMGLGFQTALRQGFRDLAQAHPHRVRLIDGSGPSGDVATRVRAAL